MHSFDGLPPLREVVKAHDLFAKKSLGQNFLFDLNLTSRIARSAGALDGFVVIEVGPGPGGLTRAILAQGAKTLIAIERDSRCLSALQQIEAHYPGRLTIIDDDALIFDPRPLLNGRPAKIVANLPYNIGTALLINWLTLDPWPPWWASLTLMFQREVAERIVATPDTPRDYGRLSVLSGWRTDACILFDVPPSAFIPPPKVVSSVVHLTPKAQPLPCAVKSLETVTRAAFGQRRKMLRQSLKGLVPDTPVLLAMAGLVETIRAEDVPVAGYVALANAFDALRKT